MVKSEINIKNSLNKCVCVCVCCRVNVFQHGLQMQRKPIRATETKYIQMTVIGSVRDRMVSCVDFCVIAQTDM